MGLSGRVSAADPALGVPTGRVAIVFNGVVLRAVPLVDGRYEARIADRPSLRRRLTVVFEGNERFAPSTASPAGPSGPIAGLSRLLDGLAGRG